MTKLLLFPPSPQATSDVMRQWRRRRLQVAVDQLAARPWLTSQQQKVLQLAAALEASSNA